MKILSPEQQKQIIETTSAGITSVEFEQLALLWRNYSPEGAKPDLGKAVLRSLCNQYFRESSSGLSHYRDELLPRLISYLLAEVKQGERSALEEISSRIREQLKNSIGGLDPYVRNHPNPGGWIWSPEEWLWQLALHDATQGVHRGHIILLPLQDGHSFTEPILPGPLHHHWAIEIMLPFKKILPEESSHNWAINYVLRLISGAEPLADPFSSPPPEPLHRPFQPLSIPLKGHLNEVKHQLDLLLGIDTPPLPEATEYSLPDE